jgi:hypothetical protein
MKGITPMKSHKWTPHAVVPTGPDPMGRTTRGVLILALVLGGMAADAAAFSGTGGHVSALEPGGSIHVGSPVDLGKATRTNRPWMF